MLDGWKRVFAWLALVTLTVIGAAAGVACGNDAGSGSSSGSTGGTSSGGGAGGGDGAAGTSSSSGGGNAGGDAAAEAGAPATFAVGGTVHGLDGATGLVLQLNGGTSLPIAADGAFAFATRLASGAKYTVSISTQPDGRICTVSAGGGTVVKADVTSVVVDCDPNTFTLGGTVTGLASGATVTLADGAVTLTRDADGPFAFPTPIATGTAYDVTVSVQPTNPTQVCTVANGSGTVGGVDVTNVAVTCVTSTFTVGGSVTGLAGGSVTLRNNEGDNLTVGADGAFVFPTPIESGGAYAVTVLTHPTGPTQTCTVTGGSGTVTSANVTGVTVTCATVSFKIGGTASGLAAGKSLVLQNNGGDDLTVAADGAFQFATPRASGLGYAVTIATQPVGQTCSVSGAAGTVGAADVSSVVVNCASNSYTIGGTVTGLAGTVTLQNNSGNALTLSANGQFAFSAPVLSGATYEVTVSGPPTSPTQVCTITNGAGTVGGANVEDVQVHCVTSTYSVGGAITGLAPNQSVVLGNGGDSVTVTANGAGVALPFTFANAVASGASYGVTVSTQPGAPIAQTCVVTGGSGVVTNQNVTSVAVACTTNRYTVGGTVTGLAGTLVVRNNGGDDKTLTGSGAFTFETSIASGGAYAVTVFQNPTVPSQSCVVTSGSGTVTNANVTNVAIACTRNTFKIKGTVTGLDTSNGNTVVLQNSSISTDEVTVSGNTGFEFPIAVPSGFPYNVTVKTGGQPANPSQTCTVSSGSGTVGSADVTNVSVNCETNTYTYGGTITGLASGSTVVLANGATTLSVTGGGGATTPFNFPAVASGASYDVTVQTNPSSPIVQTCSVWADGSGTVTNANVTSIRVSCTTASFKVKVAVSGHSNTTNVAGGSSSLGLNNNGGNLLTVNANGTFEFTTSIASGNTYAVTVANQPTNPEQVCTVTNGSGTIANADVTANVACQRTTVTVGGTVNGLWSGASIVVRNNGGSDVTVNGPATASSTTFSFGSFANGSSFSITATNPSGSWRTLCLPRDDGEGHAGSIPSFNPTNVNVVFDCGRTCFSRLLGGAFPTGNYTIDPDGQGGDAEYSARCNMDHEGGGWTLIMMTNGTNGPTSTTTVQSLIPNGSFNNNERLVDGRVVALARLSSQVAINNNFNGWPAGLPFVKSEPGTVPIKNLRELKILNFGVPANDPAVQQSYWTEFGIGGTGGLSFLNFTQAPDVTTWPSIYQARGNDAGFQYYSDNSAFKSNATPTAAEEGSKRVWVR